MTSHHIAKLRSLTRCPCCGAEASDREEAPREIYARVAFKCMGEFSMSDGRIIASQPCPASAHLAAKLMNIEADGRAGRETQ